MADDRFGSEAPKLHLPRRFSPMPRELAVLDPEALQLEQAPELLDGPALLVSINDLPSVLGGCDAMGGEQAPIDLFSAARRVMLDYLDEGEQHGWRGTGGEPPAGTGQSDGTEL
jgi:hypothetical protein